MANMMQRGNSMVNRHMGAALAHDVTYRRKGKADLTVAATSGRPQFQAAVQTEGEQLAIQSAKKDYYIAADLLTWGLGRTYPERGDKIIDAGTVYEVLPLDSASPVWEFMDTELEDTYRIHTERQGVRLP